MVTEGELDAVAANQLFDGKSPVVSLKNGGPSAGKDFKAALAKREDSNGAGGKPRTADQRVRDNLNDCLKVIDNVEDPKQLVQGAEIKALLKKAIALLTSK